jgi:hypothetical protein
MFFRSRKIYFQQLTPPTAYYSVILRECIRHTVHRAMKDTFLITLAFYAFSLHSLLFVLLKKRACDISVLPVFLCLYVSQNKTKPIAEEAE